MSNANSQLPHDPAEAVVVLAEDARFGIGVLRRHGWRIVLLFVLVLLPLWAFGELAEDVHAGEAFFFDRPLLDFAHSIASPPLDALALLLAKVGYAYGVVPFDMALVLLLALRRRKREGLFAGIALGGSALLNAAAKHYFGRARPDIWLSLVPETSFSFPSGHAMGSMTLAATLVALAWHTCWRWPVLVVAIAFALLVGASRVYLGVHFPSDILAGWTAAVAWTFGTYAVVFRGTLRPWRL
ncbi:MAG TPA: phosphatase PAP2 family protein [Lysobacter sp.]|nr:phosphatase PAP2 family protein [Lysobacter sp.]